MTQAEPGHQLVGIYAEVSLVEYKSRFQGGKGWGGKEGLKRKGRDEFEERKVHRKVGRLEGEGRQRGLIEMEAKETAG